MLDQRVALCCSDGCQYKTVEVFSFFLFPLFAAELISVEDRFFLQRRVKSEIWILETNGAFRIALILFDRISFSSFPLDGGMSTRTHAHTHTHTHSHTHTLTYSHRERERGGEREAANAHTKALKLCHSVQIPCFCRKLNIEEQDDRQFRQKHWNVRWLTYSVALCD